MCGTTIEISVQPNSLILTEGVGETDRQQEKTQNSTILHSQSFPGLVYPPDVVLGLVSQHLDHGRQAFFESNTLQPLLCGFVNNNIKHPMLFKWQAFNLWPMARYYFLLINRCGSECGDKSWDRTKTCLSPHSECQGLE